MPRKRACNTDSPETSSGTQLALHTENLLQSAAHLSACGKILLTYEAIFTLHTFPPLPSRLVPCQKDAATPKGHPCGMLTGQRRLLGKHLSRSRPSCSSTKT